MKKVSAAIRVDNQEIEVVEFENKDQLQKYLAQLREQHTVIVYAVWGEDVV